MAYQSESGDIRMVLGGDVMLSRRLTPYREPDYLALVELMRGADLAFVNLETTIRHPGEGFPSFLQGTPMSTPPALLDDLKWLGVDIVSTANNHATDYGVGGVLASAGHLRDARLPFAGTGANLAEARAPAYVETAAGRVAVTAATSFFRPGNQASEQRPDSPGRPGVNPLSFARDFTVDARALAELRRIGDGLGLTQERDRHRAQFYSASEMPKDDDASVNFNGATYRRGDGFAIATRVGKADAEANLRWLKEARRRADWVIFSFHFHEFGPGGHHTATMDTELEDPADFVVDFARRAIDAGADVVAGHGPHVTLGLEVYRGRPILYSLGNFVFQNDTVGVFPAESYQRFDLPPEATPADFLDTRTGHGTRGFPSRAEYWESYVGECLFEARRLTGLRLHPVTLGFGTGRAERGRPMLARGEAAERILARLQRLSRRFGTEIANENGVGLVRL